MVSTSDKKPSLRATTVFKTKAIAILILYLGIIDSAVASSDADYSFVMTSDWHDCQQIDPDYQAVYAFETASFYVNICQKGENYFYSGEAKQSDNNSIFITAHPLENGSGFQAQNGNLSYLVLVPFGKHNNRPNNTFEPAEAVLTIKRNDRLVSVESSLNKYCHNSKTTTAWDKIELQPHNSSHLATVTQHKDVGVELPIIYEGDRLLPAKTFDSESRFDFYRIGGELHRLTTCD